MSYLVLARKYRPPTFDDVIGQEDVVQQLKGALASGRLGHAFLFCGPRGTGKTTCARILARELNKIKGSSEEMFDLDSAMDVIEIDGASNRGIDEIRTLRENAKFVPMSGSYKIYIIDEVHMLTTEAFNALLKTLEEPPAHVKFILATTDPNKLPLTVVSRCQRFSFRRIPLDLIVGNLRAICTKEKFQINDDALYALAKASQGSMRDALSVLDQLSSTSGGVVSVKDVNAMFGFVETEMLFELTRALSEKNCVQALGMLEKIIAMGKDVKQLAQDLIEFYRHLMIMKAGGKDLQDLIDYSRSYKEALFLQAGQVSMGDILGAIQILIEAQDAARITESQRLALEIAIARITSSSVPKSSVPPAASKPAAVVPPQAPARPAASVAAPKPAVKPVSSGIIHNNRGSVAIPVPAAHPAGDVSVNVTLEDIRREWMALTHAVSQKKMSLGANILEGVPYALTPSGKLTIAFAPGNEFFKEFLEKTEHMRLVDQAISQHMNAPITVEFILADVSKVESAKPEVLGDALTMFQGEVVNEWDSEEKA